MRVLILDNYDSFTYNLAQLVGAQTGVEPLVVPSDRLSWEELLALRPDAVIISPGPGRPDRPEDFGLCLRVIRECAAPLLGVCLGHQGICQAFGGAVVHAPEPRHGRLSMVRHDGSELFAGIPEEWPVVRYHSLVAAQPLPECLVETAWTTDGVLMALRHRARPVWGVQFHPESICTEHGARLIANFLELAFLQAQVVARQAVIPVPVPQPPVAAEICVRELPLWTTAEALFCALYGDAEVAFWLDSSHVAEGLARFSIMGGGAARECEVVTYTQQEGVVTVRQGGSERHIQTDLFTYLRQQLQDRRVATADWPFPFRGGYVGYCGYEVQAATAVPAHHAATTPDALLVYADRAIVVDHATNTLYLVAVGPAAAAEQWFAGMEQRIGLMAPGAPRLGPAPPAPELQLLHSREEYGRLFAHCMAAIRDGESYEVCLTNRLTGQSAINPLDYYRRLRHINPAPYSAFLRCGGLALACSSPEKFLTVRADGHVETKPIKGTARRGATPAEDEALRQALEQDEKMRAENLMIVDLLRNDLGRVCEWGSVQVPKLMQIESYPTVHQMVSTVTGQLRPGLTAVDCLYSAFPGGSMTGAPKRRTMEIIGQLEGAARGIYAGTLGYWSLDGAADLNIVIRTAVFQDGQVTIGTGGAIVALSQEEDEWQEQVLKTQALVEAFSARP